MSAEYRYLDGFTLIYTLTIYILGLIPIIFAFLAFKNKDLSKANIAFGLQILNFIIGLFETIQIIIIVSGFETLFSFYFQFIVSFLAFDCGVLYGLYVLRKTLAERKVLESKPALQNNGNMA